MGSKNKVITNNNIIEGIVVRNTGSSYLVKSEDGNVIPCRIKGNFRIKGIRTTNPVAVGDIVKLSPSADDAWYITQIIPRKNYIIRRASNLSKESHILAANIDQALLVATIFNPETSITFIDRFLATAEAYNVPSALIFNKCDTWPDDIKDYVEELKTIYTKIGYPVFITSSIKEIGIQRLLEFSKNKISLLAGNSGVGKSSLINALVPGTDLKTGEVSDVHHTGTHTTTFSEMIELPGGGALIDIPGVKGFGTIEFKSAEISHYFPEIFKKSSECKYADCRHTGEPGCAVIQSVEEGEIAASRFNSYLSIMEEVEGKPGENKYRKPF